MNKLLVLIALQLPFSSAALANSFMDKIESTENKKLRTSFSATSLEVLSGDYFDNYIISVSNKNGFSKTIESNSPSFFIEDLNLPDNGEYSYEVKAIKILGYKDKKSTLRNGRDENARALETEVKVVSGKLVNEWGSFKEFKAINEESHKVAKGNENEY